jgi:hypothetical protein
MIWLSEGKEPIINDNKTNSNQDSVWQPNQDFDASLTKIEEAGPGSGTASFLP